jgi:hypothetical protein
MVAPMWSVESRLHPPPKRCRPNGESSARPLGTGLKSISKAESIVAAAGLQLQQATLNLETALRGAVGFVYVPRRYAPAGRPEPLGQVISAWPHELRAPVLRPGPPPPAGPQGSSRAKPDIVHSPRSHHPLPISNVHSGCPRPPSASRTYGRTHTADPGRAPANATAAEVVSRSHNFCRAHQVDQRTPDRLHTRRQIHPVPPAISSGPWVATVRGAPQRSSSRDGLQASRFGHLGHRSLVRHGIYRDLRRRRRRCRGQVFLPGLASSHRNSPCRRRRQSQHGARSSLDPAPHSQPPGIPLRARLVSTALTEAVAAFFGTDKVEWTIETSKDAVPQLVQTKRTYTSLTAIMGDVDNARLWAGLHYRNSMIEGSALGSQVAKHVTTGYFRPQD